MNKIFLLAFSNMRKSKTQTVIIFILILFAAAMFNIWLVLSMDYKQNFDRCHDRLDAGHVTLVIEDDRREVKDTVSGILEDDVRTEKYETQNCLCASISFAYNGGSSNNYAAFIKKEQLLSRNIEKIEFTKESSHTSGIYLPMLYSTGNNYKTGDTINIEINGTKYNYTVCGFFNSVMAGSHNCTICLFILTNDKYAELMDNGPAARSCITSVRINDREQSELFETEFGNKVVKEYPQAYVTSNSYATVSMSRYISQMICSGIVSVMAFLVILISLVVIASNIINYIQENMGNLGVLKAVGYTYRQLATVFIFQFLSIVLVAALSGIMLSYAVFPVVNTMMVSQTGIPYTPHFLLLPFIIVISVICGLVALVTWLSSHRARKIEPIVALRQGIQTHNFKKNFLPLAETKIPLGPSLALKTTLSNKKHSIISCITMLLLSLVVTFSGLMFENVIVDMEPFVNMVVGETAHSGITVSASAEKEFLKAAGSDSRTEKVYLYSSAAVSHKGGKGLVATLCDDFSKVNNPGMCIEGRYPEYDNEIAVAAKYARDEGLKPGNVITMVAQGKEADYIISGLTQLSNALGKDCMFTRSGYERMGSLESTCYYINLSDGTDIDRFNSDMERRFGKDIINIVNIQKILDGTSKVYVSLVTVIVIIILILSILVISLVLYLLARILLNNKKKDYGVLKALGFTTGQLILQTALSFMPAIIISSVTGLVVSAFIINPLMAVFLSNIGIVKCTFNIPVVFITVAGTGLVIFAFLFVCFMSLRIKKTAPRELLCNE